MSDSEPGDDRKVMIAFDANGVAPVVAQDAGSGEVLMLAYADAEALEATLATGEAHYHSRSRGSLWRKGETSGNVQRVVEVRYDCDADALLYRVQQTGPACHTGAASCFHRNLAGPAVVAPLTGESDAVPPAPDASMGAALDLLERVVADRLARPRAGSYVGRLHERGVGYVCQKVIEEAGETVVAALEHKDEELIAESADLLFHLGVLLAERGVSWSRVARTLIARHAATHEPQA